MTQQEIHALCLQWAYWSYTRRYFAPPVPQNILAQMQPRTRIPKEPDGPLDADLCFLNMAIHGLADEDPDSAMCFALYYFHGIRPVKLGASQASCRLGHAANGCISTLPECVWTMESRSGFRVTAPIGAQLRVVPDQRCGLRARAWRYTSWRAARIAASSPA